MSYNININDVDPPNATTSEMQALINPITTSESMAEPEISSTKTIFSANSVV